MASTPLKAKPTSRWGSLLSGAVANLESRLDTILADESTIAARNAQLLQPAGTSGAASAAGRLSSVKDATSASKSASPRSVPSSAADHTQPGQSRSSSIPRTGTPLNDRPSSSAGLESTSALSSSAEAPTSLPFASSTPEADADVKSRSSVESTATDPTAVARSADVGSVEVEQEHEYGKDAAPNDEVAQSATPGVQAHESAILDSHSLPSLNLDEIPESDAAQPQDILSLSEGDINTVAQKDHPGQVDLLQSEREIVEPQRQEDVNSYLERIDALQSKLQYLAKEAAESARQAASQAPPESMEKKLAAKDEQIALLMEEGQQLSKSEVAQSSAARKLRIKTAEDAKAIAELKRKIAGMDKNSSEASEKLRKLETAQRESSAKLLRLPRLEREVDNLKATRDEKESTIQALRLQIESESKRADEAAKQANSAAVEEQRKLNESLQEDLSNAKIERQLAEDRAKAELRASHDDLQREQERNKGAELGLRNEISILETRLESLRSRTEEVSSGTTNDAQAKLLRQVETLQSQYALARENWQGIESSLQARVSALEKERADVTRLEAEARKKARESGSKARRLQESLDETTRKCQVLEHDLTQRQANADKLEARVVDFEKALKDANAKFEEERRAWDASLARRIEEEKMKWRQESTSFAGPESIASPSEASPVAISRRPNALDLPGFSGRRSVSRNASTDLNIPVLEKTHSRRSSMKPGRSIDVTSPNGFDSGRSTPFFNGPLPTTPSINEMDADDLVETGSSPDRTVNDVISGSTSAAGPSVQLVERMSAKVRKLETEKAAAKDEITRLSGQRDEARKEVVTLMREIDQKRAVDAKVAKLETGLALVEDRYQTTLEMLGEKSERVEELEADVADLKKIYRELVESTTR